MLQYAALAYIAYDIWRMWQLPDRTDSEGQSVAAPMKSGEGQSTLEASMKNSEYVPLPEWTPAATFKSLATPREVRKDEDPTMQDVSKIPEIPGIKEP